MRKTKVLAIIESTIETAKQGISSGVLSLVQVDQYYYIIYNNNFEVNVNNTQGLVHIAADLQQDKDLEKDQCIILDCHSITSFILREEMKNDKKFINILLTDCAKSGQSKFTLEMENMISLSNFITHLIIHGIALPSSTRDDPYSFVFYVNSHASTFVSLPSYLLILPNSDDFYSSLEIFWTEVLKLFKNVVIFLSEIGSLPADSHFQLGIATNSMFLRSLIKIDQYVKDFPQYTKITESDLSNIFDSEGKIISIDIFKKRLYCAGMEPSLLPKLLPFVFGVFPYESSLKEREEINERLIKDYQKITFQVNSISTKQFKRHRKLRDSFRVIVQDSDRTDRLQNAFKIKDKPGLILLTNLLRSYSVFNPFISYLQGMNDLFVPLIFAFIPKWSDNSDPLGEDGQIIDVNQFEYLIFWCFESMVRNISHDKLLSALTARSMQISNMVVSIVCKIEPTIGIWLSSNNLSELIWMYSDFVYLYKRTFNNRIWDVWLQLNCAPDPKNWIIYFVSAILLKMLPFISVKSDLSIAVMMDVYPNSLKTIDLCEIGKVAMWLYENYPLENDHQKGENLVKDNYDEVQKNDFDFCEFFP